MKAVLHIFLRTQWGDPWKDPHLVFLNMNIPLVTSVTICLISLTE